MTLPGALLVNRFARETLPAHGNFLQSIVIAMPELDRLKEQLAYLKYWQGIMVITDISLVGWLISGGSTAGTVTLVVALVGVVALTGGIYVLHHQIEQRIEQIGKL